MMRSMFAGVSGLRSHQVMMDVVGNNIANVNTIGFKSSRMIFQDTLSQMIRGESGGTGEAAGVNPQQVGLGVKVGSVDPVFSQGASQLTGRATDVAIQGEGFFVMRDGTEQLYTRAGSFSFDHNGFLTDPGGAVVQGWLANDDNEIFTNAPISDIKLPIGKVLDPIPTTEVNITGNLSSEMEAGQTVLTAIDVIDSLGAKHRITFEYEKTADNAWTLTVSDADGAALTGSPVNVTFDPATGDLTSPATAPSFSFTPPGGSAPMTFSADFGVAGSGNALTQYGGTSNAAAKSHNGAATGFLRSFAISDDGVVSGVFSNGVSQPLAKVSVANFNNPVGLVKAGNSLWRASAASGQAVVGEPGIGGKGSLAAGTVEMSNVDLAQEFTNMIIAQRGFQANSRIITSADTMLTELVNLNR